MGPLGNGLYHPAGAAPAVKGPVAVLCVGTTRQSKISAAVFAHPHPDFPLDALPKVVVDQVVNGVGLQDLCEHLIIGLLKTDKLGIEAKSLVPDGSVIRDHSPRNGLCAIIRIQQCRRAFLILLVLCKRALP